MSKASIQQQQQQDEECFHDSLDRILSSTNSSCSPSSSEEEEDEHDVAHSPNFNPNYAQKSKFPMGVLHNYDVWISQPSSVQERRSRLLRNLGLARDSKFSRSLALDHGEIQLNNDDIHNDNQNDVRVAASCNAEMLRSKSDGDTGKCSSNGNGFCNDSVCCLPEILCIDSSVVVGNDLGCCHGTVVNKHHNRSCSGSVALPGGNGSTVSPNKPPLGKHSRVDSTRKSLSGNCISFVVRESGGGERARVMEGEGDLDCDLIGSVSDPACTIKNLDTGKEFVVNEVRGDGSWEKVKEVATGRQLTMEEFEMCVGHSPIVQELMRRQNVEDGNDKNNSDYNGNGDGAKLKKKGSWLKSIKNVASSVTGRKERRSSDDRDTASERGGRRSSSATDDSQEVSFHGPERIRVRQYGKSCKEVTGLYKSQEILAHTGSIWTIKFSLNGKYLASAGEDCVIHIWKVGESERKGDLLLDKSEDGNLSLLLLTNDSPEPNSGSPNFGSQLEKKRRGRSSISRKSVSLDHVFVPETVFALSEKPFCSFEGHLDDVLDLSWSKSQHLLSSSMDKTVRLWHLTSKSCLKTFSHSDYVTCIQFNPVDDNFFISGSLDAKVRIWNISDRQVVDWSDLHEMVTAACYTPDGQAALVGSYKGSCRLYNTSDNKLQQKTQINLHNKKKKGRHRKITGFQFAPGSKSEVLITSADSRIRVVDGVDLVHKFKGFRNTNSQISASLTANGKYVVCASEDSHVYIWKHEADSRPSKSKGVNVTRSYEHFHCQDVSAAIPWPGMGDIWGLQDGCSGELNGLDDHPEEASLANNPPTPVEDANVIESSPLATGCTSSPFHGTISSATNSYFFDRIATWPEEKLLLAAKKRSPHVSVDFSNGVNQRRSAWGMVIVTAGLRGEIRTFQNFGMPVCI
ncbi:hypothetical protein DCAR_0625352 [Daucus carota subsp. sativus]|uniref:Anaphase-promoting complex subunit 4 WD40 domain-containing protein n=1 Tax=Daucus carota subsp. sativus TaxID=79200 RepID=A0AAF1B438_DAUCS|nr:PREDICTED: WD repeat-containing protein 44-like [Daucus carota subsp. sativus]WOH05929.1 hypothetical protein DCAR_0625352 [Daucus carota subsp. sativus]